MTYYQESIKNRNILRYIVGLLPRYRKFVKNSLIVWYAKKKGASIGRSVTMPFSLARIANDNLHIGDNTSIQTSSIDLRARVRIGSHVIIGFGVEILTVSHDVDSPVWGQKYYGVDIEDYCWLATRAFILPSCTKIEYGAVCGAGSVIYKNVESMSIMVGNPAMSIRRRDCVHTDLCVESLLGNDFVSYVKAYSEK